MLRAEWMDDDYWWWCVYDMLTEEENQIDSSNEYEQSFNIYSITFYTLINRLLFL
jgi:hypothetical protein